MRQLQAPAQTQRRNNATPRLNKLLQKQHRAAAFVTTGAWTISTQHAHSGNIGMVICFREVGVVVAVRVRWAISCYIR
jgi:hypothetical protein